jgi:hypothetical protein
MLIKSLLKREGGTVVDLEGVKYHFTPNINDDHVCEVDDPAHIALLFAVDKDGFEEVSDDDDITEYRNLAGKNPDLRWSASRLQSEIEKLKPVVAKDEPAAA